MGSEWQRGRSALVIGTMAVIGLGGCKPSPSERLLKECDEADGKGEIDDAWRACSRAVTADPSSKAATVAKEKLQKLQPEHEKREKERAEARAKATQAEKAAQEARLAALQQKVSPKWWGFEPDGECQAKGLPAFRKTYEGGLYAENEIVALADGCRHLFGRHSEPSPNDNIFCCPGR